jgi:hypothetical protein
MKLPKSFNKMTIEQQEAWLIDKLQETHKQEDDIRRMLAEVRKGYRYEVKEIDRPDLLGMKLGEGL